MKQKINKYISQWEQRCYTEGIPESIPVRLDQLNKAPSYKSIVRAILKNDTSLKTLGFSQTKCASYHRLKKIELDARKNKCIQ